MNFSAIPWLAISFAFGASLLFGVQAIGVKRGLQYAKPLSGAVVVVGAMALVYLLGAPWFFKFEYWLSYGFWVFVLNGLMHPMTSMYCAIQATSRTGPTIAATFSSTAPIFAAAAAIGFLGERVTEMIVAGTLVCVIGIAILSWRPIEPGRGIKLALLFATVAAIVRGLNNVISKYGFDYLPDPYTASCLSACVSIAGLSLLQSLSGEGALSRINPRGLAWFIFAGILGAAGILLMYSAINAGSVVIVAPIFAAYPIFTLLAGLAIHPEPLPLRSLAGLALTIVGVIVVVVGG